jgi:hypothetical protein
MKEQRKDNKSVRVIKSGKSDKSERREQRTENREQRTENREEQKTEKRETRNEKEAKRYLLLLFPVCSDGRKGGHLQQSKVVLPPYIYTFTCLGYSPPPPLLSRRLRARMLQLQSQVPSPTSASIPSMV